MFLQSDFTCSDFFYVVIFAVLPGLITLYCRIFKIKAVETAVGLVLFSCLYWIFYFADAFMK